MFDRSTWRMHVGKKLDIFARNPRQEIFISSGPVSLLTYLATCTLEPFLLAYETEPITAIQTLASISQASEMNAVVRRAPHMRYQSARLLEYELRNSSEWRTAIEQLLVGIDTIQLARQRLHGLDADWFTDTLRNDIDMLATTEFMNLRRRLVGNWKSFQNIFQELRQKKGHYTQEELILIYVGLGDSSTGIRAQAARRLGEYAWTPSENMVNRLIQIALHDIDLEPRNAACRALGGLRDRLHMPDMLDTLNSHLRSRDRFVRTATAMLLSQLGEMAAAEPVIHSLTVMLDDTDDYAREAAANALGRMGANALVPPVMEALARALDDDNEHVHTAALDALTALREHDTEGLLRKKGKTATRPLPEIRRNKAARQAPLETQELPEKDGTQELPERKGDTSELRASAH